MVGNNCCGVQGSSTNQPHEASEFDLKQVRTSVGRIIAGSLDRWLMSL